VFAAALPAPTDRIFMKATRLHIPVLRCSAGASLLAGRFAHRAGASWTRLLTPLVLGALLTSGCTSQARNDVAKTAFIKAVNLKCKVSKAEARFAWDLADQLSSGPQAAAQKKAKEATSRLLADIDRLDGPVDVAAGLQSGLRSSQKTLDDVNKGQITIDEGKAKLEELRQSARDQGFGECVSA
jgi:hypothetical protein